MRRLIGLALVVGGLALGIEAYHTQTHALHSGHHSLATVAVAWAFLAAGLVAWARRPANRMGGLMMLTAFALLARQLRYSDDAVLFTLFFVLGDVGYALVGHSALAYPSGRVTDRFERALVVAGYTTVLVLPPLTALFYDGTRPMIGFDPLPRDSLISVTGNADVVELLQKTQIVIFFGVLATLFIVLVGRRFWHATPRMRRILAPLLLAAVAFALRAIYECVFTFVNGPLAYNDLFWWQVSAFVALPLALVAGLLRAHLARAGVGTLVLELDHAEPQEVRDALARTLGDPTLQVAFWLPDRGTYADAAGQPVELPEDQRRAVTYLEHEGEPLAAIVHDPSLLDEPELVRAAGAAARLSLENARLQADMRAQIVQVQESRKRIVAAADEERRRIERDLHDGAQQRLAALALEALALRNPFPIDLDVLDDRLPPQVEATAYFVACEALANVAKHARASKASVAIAQRDGLLAVEVSDDGVGGAQLLEGSGLSGLSDRVEALGGRLWVQSPAGGGTRVLAQIPCGS